MNSPGVKWFRWSMLAATLLAVTLLFPGWIPLKTLAASAHPYTVVRTESVFDDTGALRVTNRFIEALRSDGSTMRRSITPVGDQRRIDIAYGDEILTNERQGRKSTYPKAITMPPQRTPESSCVPGVPGWTVSGIDNIGGYRAVRLVYPGKSDTRTAWYALDAGCAQLESRLDHEGAISVQKLTSLAVGEPDPSLFTVQASFNEVPPSALLDPVCNSAGRCTSMPEEIKQQRDAKYYAARGR
jgi:hypothetical protein